MKKYLLKPPAAPAGGFRINYEAELNQQQLEVVLAGDGPMLVIAGAGSGKTRTLTYRVARLVECGVPMESVLLLTFTNKAAREMLRRVAGLLGTDLRILGGTFHHVANVVLRRYADRVGLKPNFTILDREDAADVMSDVLAGRAKLLNAKKFPKADVVLEIQSYAVNTETLPQRVLSERFPVLFEVAEEVLRAIQVYALRKREMNLVDFDDLLLLWRDLLRKHDDVRETAHQRWRYVLVDEYQDTNRIQSDIVEMIAGPEGNLMVVGDDAQSIYSFRGANFGNIIDFPKRFPSARMFKLEINYRSTPEILALANSSIRHNARQFEKVLQANRAHGPKPERVVCGDVSEQARYVVQRMMELRDESYEWRDMAVLYRAHWHSMEIQMELTQRGIPFQVRSGLRFFEQAHIKDVAAYMRIVVNSRDEFAWKRVAKLYPRIGNVAAEKIWKALEAQPDPLGAVSCDAVLAAVPKGAREGWKDLTRLLQKISTPEVRRAPSEMIREIIDGGYELYLQTTYANASARAEDVRRMADFALRFRDAQELLSELALTMSVAGQEAIEEREDTDVVILSTVHQAKGLEWRAVFGIWLVDGKVPDARALHESGGEEEERRLFYVMCTRAKDQLALVHPTIGDERGVMGVIQRPSRFITELDQGTFEEVRVGYEFDEEE
ncbi:MAG: ATP-dependent helicase [Planctomycetes bacterium]|nr:ATP-dependent helicase [Planctomycetota bacterium]